MCVNNLSYILHKSCTWATIGGIIHHEAIYSLAGRKIDLLEVALKVSRIINPELKPQHYLNVIERIVDTANRQNIASAKPKGKIFILSSTIHKTFGITIPDKPSSQTGPEYGMIDVVLNRKKGNCLGLVTLYLIVSERLGIPLSAETISSHIILKYNDNKTIFYVEATTEGSVHDNLNYLNSIIKGDIITGGRDLLPLSKKDIIAEHLYNAGILFPTAVIIEMPLNAMK